MLCRQCVLWAYNVFVWHAWVGSGRYVDTASPTRAKCVGLACARPTPSHTELSSTFHCTSRCYNLVIIKPLSKHRFLINRERVSIFKSSGAPCNEADDIRHQSCLSRAYSARIWCLSALFCGASISDASPGDPWRNNSNVMRFWLTAVQRMTDGPRTEWAISSDGVIIQLRPLNNARILHAQLLSAAHYP